jgi:hypothetical protein
MIADHELRAIGLSARAVSLWAPLIRVATAAALLLLLVGQSFVCWKLAVSTLHVRAMADFGVFYESARRVLDGRPPYAVATNEEGRPTRPPNLTPPHVVATLTPLATLPLLAAAAVWAAASVVSALAALAIVFRESHIRVTPRSLLVAATALVTAAPTGALLFSGQITWLLWGPATLAWALARRGRWTTAALLVGALASIKPFLLLFAPALLAVRAWRAGAIVIATATACLATGAIALGGAAFAGWTHCDRCRGPGTRGTAPRSDSSSARWRARRIRRGRSRRSRSRPISCRRCGSPRRPRSGSRRRSR